MGVSGGPNVIQDGLVLALDAADRNSYVSGSTIWTDLSGNNKNGTLTNAVYGTVPIFSSSFNGVLNFTSTGAGTGSLVNLGTGNTFFPLNNFTLETWINTQGTGSGNSGGMGLISITYGLIIAIAASKNLNFRLNTDNTISTIGSYNTTGYNLMDGNWHYCAATWSSNTLNLYIDGNVATTVNDIAWSGSTFWPTNTAQLGTDNNNTNLRLFNGSMGSSKVYNRALSPVEIKQNYNATKIRFGLT